MFSTPPSLIRSYSPSRNLLFSTSPYLTMTAIATALHPALRHLKQQIALRSAFNTILPHRLLAK